jgi:hypothetical protein
LDKFQRLGYAISDFSCGPSSRSQTKTNIVGHIQVGKESIVLKDHAKAACFRSELRDVSPVEFDRSTVGILETGNHS